MNDTQTHAFPSDPAGYQPQQGLTKREYIIVQLLAGQYCAQAKDEKTAIAWAINGANALLAELGKASQ